MPIHDYICPDEHLTEKIVPPSQVPDSVPCGFAGEDGAVCGKTAVIYWQSLGRRRNAQAIDPIVVHMDKDGNIRFPGRADAKVPEGFERVEARTLQEARKLTERVNAKDRAEWEQREERKAAEFEHNMSENRRELRSAMEHMTPRGRDLAKAAMERTNNRRRPDRTPTGYFEVAEFDASNRDEFRDRDTNWKGRK